MELLSSSFLEEFCSDRMQQIWSSTLTSIHYRCAESIEIDRIDIGTYLRYYVLCIYVGKLVVLTSSRNLNCYKKRSIA